MQRQEKHPLIVALFEAVSSDKLNQVKAILKALPELSRIQQQEKILVEDVLKDNSEINVQVPQIDRLDAGHWDDKHEFCYTLLQKATLNQFPDVTRALLEAKAKVNWSGRTHESPLMYGAYTNNIEIVSLLLDAKADSNIQSYSCGGDSALMVAARDGYLKIVTKLLETNANPDLQDRDGDTALTLACFWGRREIVHELITKGKANIELKNSEDNTAILEAINEEKVVTWDQVWNAKKRRTEKLSTLSLLIKHGAIARRPKEIFRYIEESDQRDPSVKICLEYLCQQLKYDQAHGDLYNQINCYTAKLNYLIDIFGRELHKQILIASDYQIPLPILNIICEYEGAPLQNRVRFFKAAECTQVVQDYLDGVSSGAEPPLRQLTSWLKIKLKPLLANFNVKCDSQKCCIFNFFGK